MEIVTWIYLVGIAVIAFAVAYFQYFFKQKDHSRLIYGLAVVRGTTLFLILLLLVNPKLTYTISNIIKADLLVGIDNSESVKYNENDNEVLRVIDALRSDEALNQKFNIQYFGFGNQLYVVDSLSFNEGQTNLSLPVEAFNKLNPNAPVILITDGNQTIGKQVEFAVTENVLFPVVVGDTTKIEDIYISRINANRYSFLNNRLPVEVFAGYQGDRTVRKRISVLENGQTLYETTLMFSNDNSVQTVTPYLEANEPGVHYYTVSVETLENEVNITNNTASFSVEVIDEQSEILVLYGVLHPDIGMLKKAIETNRQRHVELVSIEDFDGDLDTFDLVICYQPNNAFSTVFRELNEQQDNYLCITGPATDWEALNQYQPFVRRSLSGQFESYQPIFNPDYMGFVFDDIGFDDFAPVLDVFGQLELLQPYDVLLYKRLGTIETEDLLMASMTREQQRVMFIFGENIWQWRINSHQQYNSFNQFDDLVNRIIQYLSANRTSDRLLVDVEPFYHAQRPIEITATYSDNNFNIDLRAVLQLHVFNAQGEEVIAIPFSRRSNTFRAVVPAMAAGDYSYTVSVEGQDLTRSGKFKVLRFNVEQQSSQSQSEVLNRLASSTSGRLFYTDQMGDLRSLLLEENSFRPEMKTVTEEKPLIEWQWLLGLIAILLGLEWFVRKYHGKI